MPSRPLSQGFRGPDRIDLWGTGVEELLKSAQRHRLIGHDHLLTGDQGALDPATGDFCLRTRRRATTTAISAMPLPSKSSVVGSGTAV